MLTIQESRKILGDVGQNMTDQEIIELRDTCQGIVELTLDQYFELLGTSNKKLK